MRIRVFRHEASAPGFTGRQETSWIGGSADVATGAELLAAVCTALGDCGGEGHQWTTTSKRCDDKTGAEFIIQTLTCPDSPSGQPASDLAGSRLAGSKQAGAVHAVPQ